MTGWVEPDQRDAVVDFVREISTSTDICQRRIVKWLEMNHSKYYHWQQRYGKSNEHNGQIPRDWWLEDWEIESIVNFYIRNPFEGYRRLTYMMLDLDIVAVSPSTVYRVLSKRGLLGKLRRKVSQKGTGFVQPTRPHEHWHIDFTYLNLGGTFYYLCSILDGYSRFIVHWEIREAMKERDVEIILQRALEKFPGVGPRIISDNGPQFVAREFKEFIGISGLSHVRTSPYYPQSNGKQERMQGLIKQECVAVKNPGNLKEARKNVGEYVELYNRVRLHSAIGYIAPLDMLEGKQAAIYEERDRKLETARMNRKVKRLERQKQAS